MNKYYKFTPKDKPCRHCASEFTPTSRSDMFCSPDCKEAVYRARLEKVYAARRAARATRSVVCSNCAKVFTTRHTTKATCSSECSVAHRRAHDRAEYAKAPHKQFAQNANRRAKKAQATPEWSDLTEIREIYKLAKERDLVVDHIVPLMHERVCGLHVPANLRCIPQALNAHKQNRYWADM